MNQNVVIIGASGHGKVIADIIEKSGDTVVGFWMMIPHCHPFFWIIQFWEQ